MNLPDNHVAPRRQLSQDVASYVRELIISGKVRKEQFLRIEAIAKAMQTSSTPVREGLLLLQNEGFVKLVPRRGFMVVGFSKQDVRDIFWTQGVLAGELAARAALSLDESQREALGQLLRDHRDATEKGDEALHTRLAHQFHRTINLGSGSTRLAVLLGKMTKQLPNQFYGLVEEQVHGAVDYHALIYHAILERDAEKARQLMTEHLTEGGEILVKYLERQGVWAEDQAESATGRD
ncbi:GntR family transcriptional regulator [Antarctobacter sp.]|uniref:GntR family transcriptional regulator n=1 Tax=Antarctobacter sp. TaxID=1872577 RepID=UPI003A8DDAC4